MTHSDYLAVFDWNSTLLNDMDATSRATNECLAFFDVAPISIAEIQEYFTFPLIHFYEKVGIPVDDYLKNAEELGNVFRTSYNKFKTQSTLMDGTIELLEWLHTHNVNCKILSNLDEDLLKEDAVQFGIDQYFDTISGTTDPATLVSGTNKYERLRDFMEDNSYSNDKTFIIGDSHEEPELARKLNILGISITGGLLSPKRLEKYKKDYVIDNLTELPAILVNEWGLKEPKTKLA